MPTETNRPYREIEIGLEEYYGNCGTRKPPTLLEEASSDAVAAIVLARLEDVLPLIETTESGFKFIGEDVLQIGFPGVFDINWAERYQLGGPVEVEWLFTRHLIAALGGDPDRNFIARETTGKAMQWEDDMLYPGETYLIKSQ